MRARREALGVSVALVAYYVGQEIEWLRSLEGGQIWADQHFETVEAALDQLETDRRVEGHADEVWASALGALPDPRRALARKTMIFAAEQCRKSCEWELSHWLLIAKPNRVMEVCTVVAAHALRGIPTDGQEAHPWDILLADDLFDEPIASEWFEFDGHLSVQPDMDDLIV